MILAQVAATGALAVDLGSITDRTSELAERLAVARRQADFLITVGGVSAGDFDIVKLFLRNHPGVRRVQVAMRPARPQAFGRVGRLFWYALPGNPVSAFVAFDQLVRPLLLRAMGHRHVLRALRRGRSGSAVRSARGLLEFVRARAEVRAGEWQVNQVGPEGSGNLRSLVEANALLVVPEPATRVAPGDPVSFELLSDGPAPPSESA
jgi:molybdopterin molybdotransferase